MAFILFGLITFGSGVFTIYQIKNITSSVEYSLTSMIMVSDLIDKTIHDAFVAGYTLIISGAILFFIGVFLLIRKRIKRKKLNMYLKPADVRNL